MSVSESNARLVEDLLSIVGRFWSKVAFGEGDACWEWTGTLNSRYGYGMFHIVEGKPILAHRFAYILSRGHIPDGLVLLHSCDNRPCVRPEHLKPDTQQANMDDMWEKGRGPSGERNAARLYPERVARGERQGTSKMTDARVLEMRERHARGDSIGVLSREFDLSSSNVSLIVTGRRWSHVGGPLRPVLAAGERVVQAYGDKHWTRRTPGMVRGELNGNAKVTAEQVIQIRERVAAGELQKAVAAEFGLSGATVHAIVSGRAWAEIGGPVRAVPPGGAKIDMEQATAIAGRQRAGEKDEALALEFGVSTATMVAIRYRRGRFEAIPK